MSGSASPSMMVEIKISHINDLKTQDERDKKTRDILKWMDNYEEKHGKQGYFVHTREKLENYLGISA